MNEVLKQTTTYEIGVDIIFFKYIATWLASNIMYHSSGT